jgi:hypothetical protein
MARGLLWLSVNLLFLNSQTHKKGNAFAAGSVKNRMGNIRGALSTEALAGIGLCVLLVAVVALTMRDKKPRFRFDSPATTATTTSPAIATAPTGSSPTAPVTPPDLQALFVQGRAESPLIAPIDEPVGPPFVTNTDYANPPVYREIREADLGKMYAAAPKKNKRALDKVSRLGGFRTPEAMAQAFGYASVDQMLARWDQMIATGPQFQPGYFGTNASSPVPWQD